MKKTILLLLGVAFAATAELPFSIEPKMPRTISIGAAPLLEMVKDGKVNFEIVVPPEATPTAKFAGKEAAEQLSQAFGAKIAVRNAPSGKTPAILIGDIRQAEKLGIDLKSFDRDGFVIRTDGNRLLIAGRDDPRLDPLRSIGMRGMKGEVATLFGVYDFLERFAGIRYYFPGKIGTVIPKRKNWTLPAIDIYDRPDLIQRSFNDYNHGGRPIRHYTGADWNRSGRSLNLLRNRQETLHIPNCHGLAYLGYPFRFGKSHPEYFALNQAGKRIIGVDERHDRSQICFSSGIKQEIIADAESFLTGKPASERGVLTWNGKPGWQTALFSAGMPCFNIMPNDSCYPCRCPECWKHFSGTEQQQSDFIWSFFADICRALKERKVSGFLTTMAYAQYRPIPNIKIPDNLLVRLAIRGAWSEENPEARDKEMRLLRDWRKKLGNKTWLWTYPGKYYGMFPGIPHTTPRAAASFTRRAKPYIFGIYYECESDHLIFNYLSYHVFGKIAWNPDVDVEQLLADHAKSMYGPAAAPIKNYFDSIERHWMRIASSSIDTPLGPKTVYPSELILWNEIYSPAEIKRLTALFDEAEKLCSGAPEYLERVKFLRNEMFAPLLDEAKKFHSANDAVNHWQAYLPETSDAIKIDGKGDDPAWAKGAKLHLGPLNGTPAEVKTIVRALRDEKNFYFLFECEEPEKIVAADRKPDSTELWKDSDVELFLSPDCDRKRYYQLLVNARGNFADLRKSGGAHGYEDYSWQSNAEVKSFVVPGKGWTAEIRLPRNSMEKSAPDGILADFSRHRVVEGAKIRSPYYCWSPFARSFGDVTRFGKLTFSPVEKNNLVSDGNFSAPLSKNPRFLGKWWTGKGRFNRDESCFVSDGASARLDGPDMDCKQYVEMKPDKEYVLSFFLRMDDVRKQESKWSGFYVRIDDGSGQALYFPAAYGIQFDGSCPWRRMEHRFRTSKTAGAKSKPYLNFVLRKAKGKAWIDCVELNEAK